MKSKLLAVCLISLLFGCAQRAPEVSDTKPVHTSWPDKIKPWTGHWEVKVIDSKAWVGMTFEDSQEFRIWLNDVSRYVKDANGMICYYRSDLKEQRCMK